MTDPNTTVDEILERLAIVNSDTDDLEKNIDRYVFETCTAKNEPNPTIKNAYDCSITYKPGKLTKIKVSAGNLVHEVRSCLDSFAVMLANLNGKPGRNTYFPISKTKAIFDADGKRKIKELSAKHQSALLALNTHGEANPFIYGMHALDTQRKHVKLSVLSANNDLTKIPGFSVKNAGSLSFQNLTFNGFFTENMRIMSGKQISERGTLVATGVPAGFPMLVYVSISFKELKNVDDSRVVHCIRKFSEFTEQTISSFPL